MRLIAKRCNQCNTSDKKMSSSLCDVCCALNNYIYYAVKTHTVVCKIGSLITLRHVLCNQHCDLNERNAARCTAHVTLHAPQATLHAARHATHAARHATPRTPHVAPHTARRTRRTPHAARRTARRTLRSMLRTLDIAHRTPHGMPHTSDPYAPVADSATSGVASHGPKCLLSRRTDSNEHAVGGSAPKRLFQVAVGNLKGRASENRIARCYQRNT